MTNRSVGLPGSPGRGLAFVAQLLFAVASASPANAEDPSGSGNGLHGRDGNGTVVIDGQASSGGKQTTQGSDSRELAITCGSEAEGQLAGLGDVDATGSANTCQTQQVACGLADLKPGQKQTAVVRVEQQPDGTWQYTDSDCVIIDPAQVTAAMVREQAVRLIPSAKVGLAPHGTTLVNIETVMWADAPRHQALAPVTILGKRVVVSLVLERVDWRFGDGESEGSGPAGKPYDDKRDPCKERQCRDYFGHVYDRTGKVTVGATATWHASFTVDGGAPVDIPGTIDGPQSTADIAVKQARGVLVPNPGD